jgi:hypothetical protein
MTVEKPVYLQLFHQKVRGPGERLVSVRGDNVHHCGTVWPGSARFDVRFDPQHSKPPTQLRS